MRYILKYLLVFCLLFMTVPNLVHASFLYGDGTGNSVKNYYNSKIYVNGVLNTENGIVWNNTRYNVMDGNCLQVINICCGIDVVPGYVLHNKNQGTYGDREYVYSGNGTYMLERNIQPYRNVVMTVHAGGLSGSGKESDFFANVNYRQQDYTYSLYTIFKIY